MGVMNIILETGFQAITHNILFYPEGRRKGKLLVESNHVQRVRELRNEGYSFLIEGYVIRQTSVTSPPYHVNLHINQDRYVTGVSCECVANKSSKCKHVYALIHYINTSGSFTQTSFEQSWKKKVSTRQLGSEKYSKGCFFNVMFPPKSRSEAKLFNFSLEDLEHACPLRTALLEESKNKAYYFIQSILCDLLDKIVLDSAKLDCEACAECFIIMQEERTVYNGLITITADKCRQFFNKNIVLNESQIIELCIKTMDQSQCKLWFESRYLRLSASLDVHRIKSLRRKSEIELANDMLNPNKVTTASMQYGVRNETKARKEYEKMFDVKVVNIGVVVSRSQPWLCASVDGVVISESLIVSIVEIKCPITCVNKKIVDQENKTCNVKYLHFIGDNVELKESSSYYTQVQIQMYLTGLSECDLFVWSPVGSCCVTVHRNEEFLSHVISVCETFYFETYLTALCNKDSDTSNQ